ncbi:MAG: hypothetical protein PVG24_03410 [Gammaproteobacteria bacterium]|jgi:hypothetical protein
MKIAVTDRDFVDKRKIYVRTGPIVLGVCLVVIAAFGLWAWLYQPLLANPFEVARQINDGRLDDTTIVLMAVMFPIAMLVGIGLTAAVVALCWAGLAKEKRYMRIIDSLSGEP